MKHKAEIPKNHPKVDRTGWHSTFDILKMFRWRRGLLKNWIEQDYVKPKGFSEDGRGRLSYFAGFQLYTLMIFKHLLDVGIPRRSASAWSQLIENEIIRKRNINPTFALFELKNKQCIKAHFIEDQKGINIDWVEDSNDFFVLNFRRIIEEVDRLS